MLFFKHWVAGQNDDPAKGIARKHRFCLDFCFFSSKEKNRIRKTISYPSLILNNRFNELWN